MFLTFNNKLTSFLIYKNATAYCCCCRSSDDDGDIVNGLLMVQFDMVDMLRKKKAHKRFQRRRSERKSYGKKIVL